MTRIEAVTGHLQAIKSMCERHWTPERNSEIHAHALTALTELSLLKVEEDEETAEEYARLGKHEML